eukprot:COSAG02_NODE_6494_length_3538_cov_1.938936_4_plen_56_part_00
MGVRSAAVAAAAVYLLLVTSTVLVRGTPCIQSRDSSPAAALSSFEYGSRTLVLFI